MSRSAHASFALKGILQQQVSERKKLWFRRRQERQGTLRIALLLATFPNGDIPAKKTGLPQWLRDEVEQMTYAETRLELEHEAEMARILKSAAMGMYIGRMESSKQGI